MHLAKDPDETKICKERNTGTYIEFPAKTVLLELKTCKKQKVEKLHKMLVFLNCNLPCLGSHV